MDVNNQSHACILGVWDGLEVYQYFMTHVHDEIFFKNEQIKTYESISVSLFNSVTDIPGIYEDIEMALNQGKILRVADTVIRERRESHFIKVQNEIWNPGMKKGGGMYAGAFSRSNDSSDRFLVSTLWKDETHHQEYLRTIFPTLRSEAGVENDIKSIQGRVIRVEPTWTVVKGE